MSTLASASSSRLFGDALPWILLLLGLVVAGFIVIYMARRLVYGEDNETVDDFTLHGLRELHKSGQLSDEEFEKARAAMIERVKRAAEREDEDGEATSEKAGIDIPEQVDGSDWEKSDEVEDSGNGSSEKTE